MRDDDVRSSCFASLDVLCAKFGEVSERLREDEDGPMLELLKSFHGQGIVVPDAPRVGTRPRAPRRPLRALPRAGLSAGTRAQL